MESAGQEEALPVFKEKASLETYLLLEGNRTLLYLGVFCVSSLKFSSAVLSSFLRSEKASDGGTLVEKKSR